MTDSPEDVEKLIGYARRMAAFSEPASLPRDLITRLATALTASEEARGREREALERIKTLAERNKDQRAGSVSTWRGTMADIAFQARAALRSRDIPEATESTLQNMQIAPLPLGQPASRAGATTSPPIRDES
jgi:hypothetical protein